MYCLNATTGEAFWGVAITGGYITSSPAVVGGLVFVGSTDGRVYCRNASNGDSVWSYQTGSAVHSAPAVVAGRLYVGSVDKKVYCLNATSGAPIWNFTTGGDVDSSLAVANGRVYVGSYDSRVYCLDAASGALVWSYLTGDMIWWSSPAVASGLIYIGSNDTRVYCLNATTGSLVWSYKTGGATHSPAVVGALFVGSTDGHIYAFAEPLAVAISPSGAVIDMSQSQLFSSTVTSGAAPYSYQWALNGVPVQGTTSLSWTFAPSSSGTYSVYVNVTDANGVTAKSNVASVTVNPSPSVNVLPSSVTVDVGQSCQFNGTVSGGTQPCSYLWYLNDVAISGGSGVGWTFVSSSAGVFNVYVNVTDGVGFTAKSNVALVTVNVLPSVSVSPPSVTMDVGQSKQLTSVLSGGTLPFTYQWYLNGTAMGGAGSGNYTFAPSSRGRYNFELRVMDNVGVTATSNNAAVIVNDALVVGISPPTASVNVGFSQVFNSTVSGGTAPYSLQWCLNDSSVSGATASSWVFTATSSGSQTVYLRVTDGAGASAVSAVSNITVSPVIPEFAGPIELLVTIAGLMSVTAAFVLRKRDKTFVA